MVGAPSEGAVSGLLLSQLLRTVSESAPVTSSKQSLKAHTALDTMALSACPDSSHDTAASSAVTAFFSVVPKPALMVVSLCLLYQIFYTAAYTGDASRQSRTVHHKTLLWHSMHSFRAFKLLYLGLTGCDLFPTWHTWYADRMRCSLAPYCCHVRVLPKRVPAYSTAWYSARIHSGTIICIFKPCLKA